MTHIADSSEYTPLDLRGLKKRNITNLLTGVRSTLRWNREWCEFVVTTRTTDGSIPVSTYHTDDIKDALDTQKDIYRRYCAIMDKKLGGRV